MRPVLFHLGSFPIYAYSVFVVLAYLAGLTYGWLEGRRLRLDLTHVADLSLWLFVGGIAGARLLFVVVDYPRFINHPLDILRIWQGGLVFYGGILGAGLSGLLYAKRHRLPRAVWADICGPVAMISLAIGRIGCFLNGCCYGRPAPNLPWAVVYPVSHPALGLAQIPVHPAPLYESLVSFILFGFLVVLSRRKRFNGQVFWTMVGLYSIARFGLEFFRSDPRGSIHALGLSTSQAISILGLAVSVYYLSRLWRRSRRVAGALIEPEDLDRPPSPPPTPEERWEGRR